jgi:hypothetical protein
MTGTYFSFILSLLSGLNQVVGQSSRVQNSFGTFVKKKFKIRDVHSYVHTMYIVVHIFYPQFLFIFFWTLAGGRGHSKHLPPACKSPQPEDSES